MAKSKNDQESKHLKGFWPMFAVIVVGIMACGAIYAYANGNVLQDEINSTSFWARYVPHSTKKPTTKTPTKTTTTATALPSSK